MFRDRVLTCLVVSLAAGLPRVTSAAPPLSPSGQPETLDPEALDPADPEDPGGPGAEDEGLPGVLDEPAAGPDAPGAEEPMPDPAPSEIATPEDQPADAAQAPEQDDAAETAGELEGTATEPSEATDTERPEPPPVDTVEASAAIRDTTLAIVPTETMLRPEGQTQRTGPAFSPKRRARRPASTEDTSKLPEVKARPRVAALRHTVAKGETWRTLAKRYEVDEKRLRRWNQGRARRLKRGEVLHVWVEVETPPQSVQELLASLPPLDGDGESIGLPNRGHLERGVAIPTMPSWWTLRRPDEAFGSAFAVQQLTHAIARYRIASGRFDPLSIGSMSRKTGGKLRPHSSHQSGRDIDIRLPGRRDLSPREIPDELDEVDWDATWVLVKSFIESGQVEFIFLDASRQAELASAARRANATAAQLDEWLQWPRPTNANAGVVRDEPGHTSHIHVRFRCGPQERECRSR